MNSISIAAALVACLCFSTPVKADRAFGQQSSGATTWVDVSDLRRKIGKARVVRSNSSRQAAIAYLAPVRRFPLLLGVGY